MDILIIRVLSLIALFIGTFFFGILPLCLINKIHHGAHTSRAIYQNSKFISFLICLGGGVLFATCFIHLIPEVRLNFEDYWNDKANKTGKTDHHDSHHGSIIPELVICGGFMLVYALDEFIHFMVEVLKTPSHDDTSENKTEDPSDEHNSPQVVVNSNTSIKGKNYGSIPSGSEEVETDLKESVSINGVLIVTALSFHSIFEGLSLGVQNSSHETLTLLFAIMIHKFVIAFVAGLEVLRDSGKKKTLFAAIFVFSIMTPIGILISILTGESLKESSYLVSGILNGIATGTLLYVTFLEVLQREKYTMLSGPLQFLAILLGFIVNSLIQIYL